MHVGFRLIGIGRNEYIDIMNKYRSKVMIRDNKSIINSSLIISLIIN